MQVDELPGTDTYYKLSEIDVRLDFLIIDTFENSICDKYFLGTRRAALVSISTLTYRWCYLVTVRHMQFGFMLKMEVPCASPCP